MGKTPCKCCLTGLVLSGRCKAQLVEGSGNGYLRTACDYGQLNPVRAGLGPGGPVAGLPLDPLWPVFVGPRASAAQTDALQIELEMQ